MPGIMRQFARRIVICVAGLGLAGLAAAMAAPATVTGAGITLQSVSVDLPDVDRAFPDGQGVDVVNANCSGCHSPNMVLMQPVLSSATWQEEVNKMRKLYKAPVAAEDVPAIVAYLTSIQASK
jgi:mono/diheme cytochrome c family protein